MSLEQLWAGWRAPYVEKAGSAPGGPTGTPEDSLSAGAGVPASEGAQAHGSPRCVFCDIIATGEPGPSNGVVWRGELSVAVLNAFPYASGHLLVLPVRHVGTFAELTEAEATDLWAATRAALVAIESAYRPDGSNLGANLGRAGGAGLPDHLHVHALPRWAGDTNFMTAVAGVRVMPEALPDSWERLHRAWPREGSRRS